MDEWFSALDARSDLSANQVRDLHETGFVVIPGPVAPDRLTQLAEAYDSAVAYAASEDVSIGSSTTRVSDFVNRGPEFDGLYVYEPVLEACRRVISQPFKLSTMHARTVRPYTQAQNLHVDFRRDVADGNGWPMVGFILMVDEFRMDNGATRFAPGSHNWPTIPPDFPKDSSAKYEDQVLVCGPAGSVIVYNGSVWHGHTANRVGEPRRSIQGAYIRRNAESWANQAARIRPETLDRIGSLAKYLLAV
jgi:ectoine hydroxylase-related dioxygenase (phytanoyl-CoA dioxygenase family)